jgi:hypothetical protein
MELSNNNSLITMFNSAQSALKSPTVLSIFLIGFRTTYQIPNCKEKQPRLVLKRLHKNW